MRNESGPARRAADAWRARLPEVGHRGVDTRVTMSQNVVNGPAGPLNRASTSRVAPVARLRVTRVTKSQEVGPKGPDRVPVVTG